jgi:hypothetical protein
MVLHHEAGVVASARVACRRPAGHRLHRPRPGGCQAAAAAVAVGRSAARGLRPGHRVGEFWHGGRCEGGTWCALGATGPPSAGAPQWPGVVALLQKMGSWRSCGKPGRAGQRPKGVAVPCRHQLGKQHRDRQLDPRAQLPAAGGGVEQVRRRLLSAVRFGLRPAGVPGRTAVHDPHLWHRPQLPVTGSMIDHDQAIAR